MSKQLFTLVALLVILPTASVDATLIVDIGDVQVNGTGSVVTAASFDITLQNSTGAPISIAGYSLFLDIGTVGLDLPNGVSFDTPAATYFSGLGLGLLAGAANPGTINLAPAAGDLGLGQFQTFDAQLGANSTFTLLTVNLLIDPNTAELGDYDIFLSTLGQNSLNTLVGAQAFATNGGGTLSIIAVPEPRAWLFGVLALGLVAVVTVTNDWRRKKGLSVQ